MTIAVAVEAGRVAGHFGRCGEFALVDVEGGRVRMTETLTFSGHECGERAAVLAAQGVKVLLCGGVGHGALAHLQAAGIEPLLGIAGPVDEVLEQYARGELVARESTCDGGLHHGACHGHGG